MLDDLDLQAMKECSELIFGIHDFESFTKSGPEQERTECDIQHSAFIRKDHLLIYQIEANRFLRHLVRRLIGTMIQVGIGKLKVQDFRDLLEHPNTEISGHGARAKGLTLEKVRY
ncbi:MAG: hypothetical protein U5K69_16825 [Balneolaceae bacterium]|nr:hypothetical protein [Balneolaceae bacterium]